MKLSHRTYTAYGIGCALVWAAIWVVPAADASRHTKHTLLLVLGGWWIGWLSATIARATYPPPRARRRETAAP